MVFSATTRRKGLFLLCLRAGGRAGAWPCYVVLPMPSARAAVSTRLSHWCAWALACSLCCCCHWRLGRQFGLSLSHAVGLAQIAQIRMMVCGRQWQTQGEDTMLWQLAPNSLTASNLGSLLRRSCWAGTWCLTRRRRVRIKALPEPFSTQPEPVQCSVLNQAGSCMAPLGMGAMRLGSTSRHASSLCSPWLCSQNLSAYQKSCFGPPTPLPRYPRV